MPQTPQTEQPAPQGDQTASQEEQTVLEGDQTASQGEQTGQAQKTASTKRPREARPRADKTLLAAVDEILQIVSEVVPAEEIGESVGNRVDGERLLTHFFDCLKPGYVGWHWAITVARAPRQKHATVCEIDLLPGAGALLAPQWIPWEERLEPSDVNPTDILPYRTNDERLVPIREVSDTGDTAPLSRVRVMSEEGLAETSSRWKKHTQRKAAKTKAPSTCASCGFLLRMDGNLGQEYGVCANEWSTHDATVVGLTNSCGAHSETDVERQGTDWPITPPRVNEYDLEVITEL